MTATGLSQTDHAVQAMNVWLGELLTILGWTERRHAYHALHVVLPALRTHLPVNEAADLAAQLPLLIRALFFEGWHPAKEPIVDRSGKEFFDHINRCLVHAEGSQPAEIVGAVFAVLERHVTSGEISQVKAALPEGVRRYWPHTSL